MNEVLELGPDGWLRDGRPWQPKQPFYAVLGDPVAHSLSPVMQNAALLDRGVDTEYLAARVTVGQLRSLKSGPAGEMLAGFNATAPLKEAVAALCDGRTDPARDLGAVNAALFPGQDRFDTLPAWAQTTLADHVADPRTHLYTFEQLGGARTHDPLWNAAQRQLVREGRIHNYLRMLWGKKILEWTATPRDALDVMLELNNKYALDGRDPNSYSGIFWILGRYDRAWGPKRPVFGTIRYMSSANTKRKTRVRQYLEKYA